jgi:uncharacterized protein (TIGR00369 family)
VSQQLAMPLAELLSIETVASTAGEVRMRMAWRAELCTAQGILHGGALMTLGDCAGALLAVNNLPEGAWTSTIESKTNFFRAVREGHVEAVSTPLHVGRTTIVAQTDLLDAAGKRVARVTQTQAVLRPSE